MVVKAENLFNAATYKQLEGLVITHAHEDHIGALPYVLPEFPGVPVYASTLARGLISNKIKERKLRNNPLEALDPGDTVELGNFDVTAFRIGHSIPDAMGVRIKTPFGDIVHTGDFKFDQTPVDGKPADAILEKAAEAVEVSHHTEAVHEHQHGVESLSGHHGEITPARSARSSSGWRPWDSSSKSLSLPSYS